HDSLRLSCFNLDVGRGGAVVEALARFWGRSTISTEGRTEPTYSRAVRHWVHFNARQWPLVVFETPVRFSSLQLERYFDDFEFCLARREPFVAILDLSASFLPTPEVRRDLLSFRRRTGTGAALLGEAIVAPSRPMAAWAAPLADGFDQEDARTEFFQTRADAI